MNIKTKYEIGDRVWNVYEPNTQYGLSGEVSVYDDYICSIEINENGVFYLLKYADIVDLKEEEVILYSDKEKLLAKIEEKMNEINEREKNTKEE